MTEHESGVVRVTNADIYRELLDQGRKIDRVDQTVRDVLKPGLETAKADIGSLKEHKADKVDVTATNGRVAQLEMRVYAIMSGLVAALIGLKQIGVI